MLTGDPLVFWGVIGYAFLMPDLLDLIPDLFLEPSAGPAFLERALLENRDDFSSLPPGGDFRFKSLDLSRISSLHDSFRGYVRSRNAFRSLLLPSVLRSRVHPAQLMSSLSHDGRRFDPTSIDSLRAADRSVLGRSVFLSGSGFSLRPSLSLSLGHRMRFLTPSAVGVCFRRAVRRRVLFAFRRNGSGGSRRHHWSRSSHYVC